MNNCIFSVKTVSAGLFPVPSVQIFCVCFPPVQTVRDIFHLCSSFAYIPPVQIFAYIPSVQIFCVYSVCTDLLRILSRCRSCPLLQFSFCFFYSFSRSIGNRGSIRRIFRSLPSSSTFLFGPGANKTRFLQAQSLF